MSQKRNVDDASEQPRNNINQKRGSSWAPACVGNSHRVMWLGC